MFAFLIIIVMILQCTLGCGFAILSYSSLSTHRYSCSVLSFRKLRFVPVNMSPICLISPHHHRITSLASRVIGFSCRRLLEIIDLWQESDQVTCHPSRRWPWHEAWFALHCKSCGIAIILLNICVYLFFQIIISHVEVPYYTWWKLRILVHSTIQIAFSGMNQVFSLNSVIIMQFILLVLFRHE
jgi:hypothetical protein